MSADLHRAVWRKSSRSGGNGGNCVEVAQNLPGSALIRDSKLGETSPVLALPPAQFAAFVGTIKDGQFGG
ncbi:DUF397 domain-containing protein [Haloactinomyces albus]|uniref:DUF397 domain-containing protein n=1 Tax=Haloactinomyces albus TaxID=1352928 RepID=A0AAE4CPL5_9ACTN|nr:DUF397 domain-containing protein [Haloactinomyces albus]MDR7303207.1 hypothetical protein [Haloactinomyces albus]